MEGTTYALVGGCLLAVASALGVVLLRKPVYAAAALLVHSLSLAALFAILAAPLVAVGQLIIYSGAIVVLFLFVVTLLPSGGRELAPGGSRLAAGAVIAVALVAALATALGGAVAIPSSGTTSTLDGSVQAVGRALFGPLIVAFELTAPLLLVAIVGAVVLWRRHEPRLPAPARTRLRGKRALVLHR